MSSSGHWQGPKTAWSRIALLVVFAVVVITGCGGSGDSSSGATTASSATTSTKPAAEKVPVISKAALIKQGDAICTKSDQRQTNALKAYAKKHPNWEATKSGQEKAIAAAGLPPIQKEAEELAALGAPKGDEAEVGAIVTGIEKALAAAERNPARVISGKNNPFTHVDKLAAEYGFEACSNAL